MNRLEQLRKQGFDRSSWSDDETIHVRCSQCASLVVNNVATHERGCPNARKAKTE